jgi:hypothetical protein
VRRAAGKLVCQTVFIWWLVAGGWELGAAPCGGAVRSAKEASATKDRKRKGE